VNSRDLVRTRAPLAVAVFSLTDATGAAVAGANVAVTPRRHGDPQGRHSQGTRSGVCRNANLYYNGYIPARPINKPTGIMGVPDDYKPAHRPLITTPADGGQPFGPDVRVLRY
jgi:hypothetical protein